jgi:glucose/arabinose dehydrogenase
MTLRGLALLGTAASLLAICARATAQAPPSAGLAPDAIVDVQGGQIRVVTVATGLVHPWSIALLPEDRSLLVAERSGRIRIVRYDVLDPNPVWTAEGVAAGNELKWLALHPRFAANRLVYLSYPKGGERGTTLAVARGRFDGRQLRDVRPAATSAARFCSASMRRCT